MKCPKLLAAGFLAATILFNQQIAVRAEYPSVSAVKLTADKFYRTELYFGRSRPDGGTVSDAEWEQFLVDEVTPRFPDGFTILNATGQYREKSGKIISEPSEVLVFLYTRKTKQESRRKIEEIRAAYVKKFSQESVLRMDIRKSVEVSF